MFRPTGCRLFPALMLQPRLIAVLAGAWFVSTAVQAVESRPDLKPHPAALPNTHDPGEVDKPELVPFVVKHKPRLRGLVVD